MDSSRRRPSEQWTLASDEQQRNLKGEAASTGGKNPKGGSETRPYENASAVIDRRYSATVNRESAIGNRQWIGPGDDLLSHPDRIGTVPWALEKAAGLEGEPCATEARVRDGNGCVPSGMVAGNLIDQVCSSNEGGSGTIHLASGHHVDLKAH
jgi:hypothetical protein